MAPRKSQPITAEVAGLQFRFQTDDEVRNTSVVQITNPITYDNAGAPAPQGLYDARMGPTERGDTCVTCGLRGDDCPGHAGHIELMSPVIHPLLFGETFRALRSKCLNCHRFRAVPAVIEKTTAILSLLDAGHIVAAEQLRESADAFVDTLVASGELPASVRIANEGGKDTSEAGAVATRTVEMWSAVKMLVDQPAATSGVSSSHALHFRRQVVDEFFRSVPTSKCAHCGAFSPPLRRDGHSKIFQGEVPRARLASMKASGIDVDRLFPKSSESGKMHLLLPRVVLEELRHLWRKEKALCARVWNVSGAPLWKSRTSVAGYRSFVIHTVEVPPSACRPPLQFGGGSFEHPHNYALKQILNTNIQIVELHRKMREAKADADAAAESDEDSAPEPPLDAARAQERLIMLCLQLQEAVNSFCDASLGNGSAASAESTPGVRQLLEKKEGLFRKHMMGKRVNYAARSVISPDPYIGTDEIGIPEYFATRLSFPTPVTHINAAEMRQRVLNGPSVHPGALSVELPSGQLIDLATRTPAQRRAIAETLLVGDASAASAARVTSGEAGGSGTGGGVPSGMERRPKIVHRHLQNGDVLLVNRQPTLHKPGMMAHRVRVLPRQKTVRMHYANCNTYNADFDGDEINLHCPQDELARAELYTIANTDNQYIVPTSGAPLRGLIQDHIVAGVLLTQQGTLLEREAYMQLVYEGLVGAIPAGATITTVPPAILRPRALWTGKQVVSTVLLNLTRGQPPLTLRSKCKVPARQWGATSLEGELVIRNGILCTGVLEKSQFGASKFGLVHACFELYGARLAGVLLTTLGRLCTVFLQGHGFTCAMADLVLVEKADEDRLGVLSRAEIETAEAQKALLERLRAHSLESVLHDDTARAQLDALTKGRLGPVASDVISTCLPGGQQVPFPRNCMSLMTVAGAKGSIVNFSQISCLLGQQELEGRRVPVMPNGATLPTFAPHDAGARAGGFITQRFLTGVKPPEFFFHCMAGREGLVDTAVKTSRSGYLQRCIIKHLESLQVHYDRTVRDADGAVMQFLYGEDGVDVTRASYMGQFTFLAENHTACAKTCGLSRVSPEEAQRAAQLHSLSGDEADPLTASYDPSTTLGAVSAAYQEELDTYITKNPDGVLAASPGKVKSKSKKAGKSKSASDAAAFVAARRGRVPVEAFQGLMWLRYMRALVDPGEQVGVIAGQSIGEPSTQMTLNSVDYETRLALLWTAPHTPSEQLGASRASCTEALHVPSLPAAGGCVPAPAADGAIGAFIDALIDAHSKNVQWQDGNRTAYLALPPGAALALSPDEHGNMVWTPVEAVTRHPPVNRDGSNTLVRVRTRHGREVVVTRAKSLLVERNGLLVPIEGDQVRVGDRVPVAAALRTRQSDVGETRAVVSVLDLRSILPTSSVAFVPAPTNAPSSPSSSGATAARELPPVSRSVLNAEGECGGPALVVALLSAGVTCPALATATCVPALLPLTYGFGAFVGAYLAGGTLAQGRVCVRATDTANASSIAAWARGVGARCALDACSVRVHSDIIALMVEHLCGRGENGTLRMPAIAAAAPLAFARGVLMNLVWDEVCESPRATVAQLWRESTAGSSTRSAVCRSSAVRDGAALVAARVWPHCSTRCVGDAAVEVAFGAKSDFHKSTLGDVLLDEIVALEDVASTHEFVYDLTVASTRNMCTMSGLGHRDTFHLAGTGKANVTLGIPRLREIIMTAAENIATPSLIAPIRTEVVPTVAKIMHAAAARSVGEAAARPLVLPPLSRGDTVALSTKERESAAALLRASLRPVRFSDIVGAVEVTERLGAHAGARVRVYDIEIELRGAAAVATGAAELDRAVRESLLARALCPALQHAARATAAPAVTIDASQGAATDDADNEDDVAPRSTRQPRAEDSDSDGDDDNEDGDGSDAGGAALEDQRAKKRERVSYDDDTEDATPVPSPDTDGMIKDAQAKKKRGSASSALKFVADVSVRAHASQKDTFTARVKVCMPVSLRRLFMVKMVEDAAARATLREALNIRDCFVVSERGQVSVQTDGVNFEALESYDALLDVDNLQCNDLHAVLRRYGVEAARATVIREVAAVFAVYGIAVDPRHLGLIADYMTFHGGLRPMNRTGIVSCASPLQRVSFETATQFLVAAATAGTVDSLSSPSSAIVVGRPYRGGTSAFEVRCPL